MSLFVELERHFTRIMHAPMEGMPDSPEIASGNLLPILGIYPDFHDHHAMAGVLSKS